MKRIFQLLLLILLLSSSIFAKDVKLRVFVFGDTNDDKIGASVSSDIQLYKDLVSCIKDALKVEGVTTTLDAFTGYTCSYDKLNTHLDHLSCEGDIILFIYNGHGARSHNDVSKFPRMCLGSNYIDKWMKVSDLNEKLRSKNPRLMVVLTDCCNSYFDRGTSNNESAFGIATYNSNGDGFRELFLHSKGEVCITGSSPGEYGWGLSEGGLFSLNALAAMYEADTKGSSANWEDVMRLMSDKTYNKSLKYYNQCSISNTQRPVYEVNVIKANFDSSVGNTPDSNGDGDTGLIDVDNTNSIPDDPEIGINNNTTDDDELYEDGEEEMGVAQSLFNSIWIALVGIFILNCPKFINIKGNTESIIRVIGIIILIWSIISFFVNI